MSFNHLLTTSQHEFVKLATSWQVGLLGSQRLTTSLKNKDVIESVNIAETCEKLCSALNDRVKNNNDNEKLCKKGKPNLTFRDCSNIWFGTLKIYQKQVNTLFRLTQELFSRSCSYNVKRAEVRKRNSSLITHKLFKKRRLTISETFEETYSAREYSQLLEDFEELSRRPTQGAMLEHCEVIPNPKIQYQIRQITLQDISNPLDEVDEDSGFGEATHEEIAQFFNFVGGNKDVFNTKRNSTKRKFSYEEGLPAKKTCLINDLLEEPIDHKNMPFNENISTTPSLKRSITPIHSLHDKHQKMEREIFGETNFIDNNDYLETDKLIKENLSNLEYTPVTNIHCRRKKKNNLIIDHCIKIDVSEILETMKIFDLSKYYRKRTLNAYKNKRTITALELLTRFNRRSLKLPLSLKQKVYLSRKQFERDYLNLLREIFKCNYKEKWASEVYPKWINFGDELLKRNKKQRICRLQKQKIFILQPGADISNLNETLITNLNESNYEEIPANLTINQMELLNASVYDKWRPYGVMLKLFTLWHSNQSNQIGAITLFKLAKNQIERALGFNSLLHLSKKRFVNLTNHPESIELQNILIGNAAKRILANYT